MLVNQPLQVLLICHNQYLNGMFTGYFHALGDHLIDIQDNRVLSEVLMSTIPDIVFWDFKLNKGFPDKNLLKVMLQQNHGKNIPICGLGSVSDSNEIEQSQNIKFDNILLEPINMTQLNEYIFDKFYCRESFSNSRIEQDRRVIDRRVIDRQVISDHRISVGRRLADKEDEYQDFHSVGPFKVDNKLKCVFFNDKLLTLTNKEYKLFRKLACESDRVVSDEEIIDYLWPGNSHATKADLHQYMYLLRKKIESDPKKPKWITTVKGFGYRLLV